MIQMQKLNLNKKIIYSPFSNYDLWGSSMSTNYFLQHYWHFDIVTKINSGVTNSSFFPITFKSTVSLPLVLTELGENQKLWMLLHCLRVIVLFTFQSSFLKKKLVFQQIKKKNSGFLVQTKTFGRVSFNRLSFYILTILPYLRISYGDDQACVITGTDGNPSFSFVDITFFSKFLNQKHIDWKFPFYFNFSWVDSYKKFLIWSKIYDFFKIGFIQGMINWLLWSSVGLICQWGHGGWLVSSRFPIGSFFEKNIFFKNNFKF